MPILKGWELIDGKLIAIDGRKIRAQNSKHNCITQSGLDKKRNMRTPDKRIPYGN